ncbi:MAG: hypothetical protein U0136_12410 [Bdellovibrionota bacterium]
MKRAILYGFILLLLSASPVLAAPKPSSTKQPTAAKDPAAKSATAVNSADALEQEPICPEDLEKEALEKERAEAETKRKPVKSALAVWNPYQTSDDGGVGRGFSRYSGQDDYEASGTVAADAPARRGGGTHSAPPPKPSNGGSRIRRG